MAYSQSMTTNTVTTIRPTVSPSRRVAAEIRAELGRQGLNQTALARRMHVGQPWLSRRIGAGADVDLTFEEVFAIAEALGVSAERFYRASLPYLDSNQEPSGYWSSQVRDLDAYRAERLERVS